VIFYNIGRFIFDSSGVHTYGIHAPYYITISQSWLAVKNVERLNYSEINDIFNKSWDYFANSLPFNYLEKQICFNCYIQAIDGNIDFVKESINKAYSKLPTEMQKKINPYERFYENH